MPAQTCCRVTSHPLPQNSKVPSPLTTPWATPSPPGSISPSKSAWGTSSCSRGAWKKPSRSVRALVESQLYGIHIEVVLILQV